MTDFIGNAAGIIWSYLDQQSKPVTLSTLKKETDVSSTVMMMALGWLAREGKIDIEISDESFSYKITLKR
jgi:DNA-binding transcriptional regulator GbsR (MarR family)